MATVGSVLLTKTVARRSLLSFCSASPSLSLCPTLSVATARTERRRPYVSRAHSAPRPQYPVAEAVRRVVEMADERAVRREERWEKFREKRKIGAMKKGSEWSEDPTFRNQDETVSIAVQVNLDPRKPNQSLRGRVALPHGTGRAPRIAVFSLSPSVVEAALGRGAVAAGGEDFAKAIAAGERSPAEFDEVLATPDVLSVLRASGVARVLGPRGLMPNAKTGDVVVESEVPVRIKERLAGAVSYRTQKNDGLVHLPVGKASFGVQKLSRNVRAVMEALADTEPELDKKAKKARVGGKGGRFLLKAHLSATQGPGLRLDMRTADPNHLLFMTDGKMT